jgi:hypothetical protein
MKTLGTDMRPEIISCLVISGHWITHPGGTSDDVILYQRYLFTTKYLLHTDSCQTQTTYPNTAGMLHSFVFQRNV